MVKNYELKLEEIFIALSRFDSANFLGWEIGYNLMYYTALIYQASIRRCLF